MTPKRVLLVGASGMLGHRLAFELAGAAELEVHATLRSPLTAPWRVAAITYHQGIDLSAGSQSIRALLQRIAPDVVVNAVGAIKQKDLAASMDETFYLNGALPHILALANPNPTACTIHVSTDCVFQGNRGGYSETDIADAEDLYGRSKAVGELAYGRHLTLRTSIVGFELAGHRGLLSWFFRQPRGSKLPGFTRAIYSGLPTATLSRLIVSLVCNGVRPAGLWHVASEPITKYDLLSAVNSAFDLGHELVPDDSLCIDRSLDDHRFRAATATVRPNWTDLIQDLRLDWATFGYAPIYGALRDPLPSSTQSS